MSKKKRLIPFGWFPGHWGLKGAFREAAKAEYYYEGEELERKILDINLAGRLTEKEIEISHLKLDKKYGKISEEEFERAVLEKNPLNLTEKDLKIAQLNLDKKYHKVSEEEYEKKLATLKEEPYIRVAKIETDPRQPAYGGIILDWNDAFVKHLEEHGYGPFPEDAKTVEEWFNELCKNIALESFDGVGEFNELLEKATEKEQVKKYTSISDDVIVNRPPTKPKKDNDE